MSENNQSPVTLGIVGIGGYARVITDLALNHGPTSNPPVSLAAVCDPALDDHVQRAQALRDQGVETLTEYERLLERDEIDAVWLPVPIQLHRRFAEQAFAAGKSVMCEKPLAGAVQDIDAMIAARDGADREERASAETPGAADSLAGAVRPVGAVGFHDVYSPETLSLKRRVQAGQWGEIDSITVHACAPRSDRYFQRNAWAGALQRDGVWVLDSPANNACAHFINLALFLLGPGVCGTARPTAVDAELYRTANIENYETISMRLSLETGQSVLVLMTHACPRTRHAIVELNGQRGRVRFAQNPSQAHERLGTSVETIEARDARPHMLERFARQVRGQDQSAADNADEDRAVSTFEAARNHTLAINGASQAAPIIDVPDWAIEPITLENGGTVRTIREIDRILTQCAADQTMLHESGKLAFTQPAHHLDLSSYHHFTGPA